MATLTGGWLLDESPELKGDVMSHQEQKRLLGLYSDYDAQKKSGALSLKEFLDRFEGDNALATSRMEQENSTIDDFFNGNMDRKLADLRGNAARARRSLKERRQASNLGRINASRLMDFGGGSSYRDLEFDRTSGDIEVGAAVQDAADERGDFGFLTNAKLGLADQRQNRTNANTNRLLVPGQLNWGEYNRNLAAVSNLGAEERANTMYHYEKTGLLDDLLTGVGAAWSGATALRSGSSYGGGNAGRSQDGGSPQQVGYSPYSTTQQNLGSDWGSWNSGYNTYDAPNEGWDYGDTDTSGGGSGSILSSLWS